MIHSEVKLAYMAGIIDGEGSVMLSHSSNPKYRAPIVSVSSTSYEILDWIKTNFGGHICSHKTYNEKHKSHWSWRLSNNVCIEILSLILPYMVEATKIYRASHIVNNYKKVTKRNGQYSEKEKLDKLDFEDQFYLKP